MVLHTQTEFINIPTGNMSVLVNIYEGCHKTEYV